MNNQQGLSKIIILLVVALIIVGIGFVVFSMLNPATAPDQSMTIPSADPNATISPLDDDQTIETELNASELDDIEKDLKDLDSEMNSL